MVPPGSPLMWWNGFPLAFALTCVIEVPAYVGAFAALGWSRRRPSPHRPLTLRTALAVGLAVNLISHPVFWRVALELRAPAQIVAAEAVVALVEGLLIYAAVARRGTDSQLNKLGWSLMLAVAVNTLSLSVGMLLWPWLRGS